MDTRQSQMLVKFLAKTLQGLVAQGVEVLLAPGEDTAHIDVSVSGHGSTQFLMTYDDCQKLLADPTSNDSLDILEFIVEDLDIGMQHIELAEDLDAIKQAMGITA